MKLTVIVFALLAAAAFHLVPLVLAGQESRAHPTGRATAAIRPITVPTGQILEP